MRLAQGKSYYCCCPGELESAGARGEPALSWRAKRRSQRARGWAGGLRTKESMQAELEARVRAISRISGRFSIDAAGNTEHVHGVLLASSSSVGGVISAFFAKEMKF